MIPTITVMKTMGTITAATGNPGPKGAIKVMIYIKLLLKNKKEKIILMKFFVSYSHQMDIFPKSCSNITVSTICGLSLKRHTFSIKFLWTGISSRRSIIRVLGSYNEFIC